MYSLLETRNDQGLRGVGCACARGLGSLGQTDSGALTPAEALQQAMQEEGMTGNPDFENDAWVSGGEIDVQNCQFNIPQFSPSCSGAVAPNINLFQTVSGLAVGTTGASVGILAATNVIAASTSALLGAATMGIGAIFAVIDLIFAHHAAAVKQEQGLGCAAIAAANNSLQLIMKAVQDGQMSPDDASTALDNLYSKFTAYVAPSVKHNPCNADCELTVLLRAMVLYLKSQYAAAVQAQAAAATPASSSTPSGSPTPGSLVVPGSAGSYTPVSASGFPGNIPAWLWIVAAGAAALAVL